jgi:uncharacterized protein (TIRG00374 family)
LAHSNQDSRSRFGWPGFVGLVVTVTLLWWTLHDVDLSDVAGHLRAARPVPFLAFVLVATLGFPLRTIRWRYLLRLEGEALSFAPLWHATAIGFMANNLLPVRAGELARAYAATRLTRTRFSTAAATIVVERLMDGLTLVALLALTTAAGGFPTETTVLGVTLGNIMKGTAAFFAAFFAVAVAVVHRPDVALGLLDRVIRRILPAHQAAKLEYVLEGLLEGLHVLRSWRRLATVALLSFAVWGVNGASFWICNIAFDLQIPWTSGFLLQALIAFGVAVPSSPGFFGPFEAVTRAALALYGVPASLAVSYAVGYHLSTFLPITLLGLYSLSRAHLHLADLRAAQRAQHEETVGTPSDVSARDNSP